MSLDTLEHRRIVRRERVIVASRTTASDFFNFVRERGVAGFAVGFVLGGAVGKVVEALTTDILDPLVGLFLGPVTTLSNFALGQFKIGDFMSSIINFLLICFAMFLMFRLLKLEQIDKAKK